jgi:uncharacterized protein (TIGR02996 family)
MPDLPDLPDLLAAIRNQPDDEPRWLGLAAWLRDHGRDDEAAVVRVFWPTLRDTVTVCGVSLHQSLRKVARNAARLGRRAREVERRAQDRPTGG